MNKDKNKIINFTDLKAWKEAHALSLEIYKATKFFPKDELFGLTSQMRRSSVSITSNIAEGFSRQSYKEKCSFYYIALGSVTELQSQLLIAKDIKYLKKIKVEEIYHQTIKVHKILNGLIKSSKEKHNS